MGYKQYCKDYEKIENYQKAKKDNFKGWECHHRLETHTPDGERRLVDITQKELITLGMYYNRPASELIFLTVKEHNAYRKGKPKSDEHKKKLREAMKGKPSPNKGKHFSEEHKNKIREANKGKHLSEETKNKMREANKGKRVGEKHPMYGKHHTEETKNKMRESHKGNTNTRGKHWYNNGKINTMAKECPEGFVPGIIKGEQNPY